MGLKTCNDNFHLYKKRILAHCFLGWLYGILWKNKVDCINGLGGGYKCLVKRTLPITLIFGSEVIKGPYIIS